MTNLFLYTLKSAFVLTALYVPYTFMLRKEKMLHFNRFVLLGILLLSLVLPLLDVSVLSLDGNPVVHAAQQQMIDAGIPIRQLVVTASAPVQATSSQLSWFDVVSIVYVMGMFMVLLFRLVQLARMGTIIRGGSLWQQREEDGITVYCHADSVKPFSWLRSIVISEDDYNRAGREIILHERGHILYHHSLDILLLTLVEMLQWWNPFSYMLDSSLRDVHEYEADDYVLRQGVSARGYQMLIINKAVGSSSYTFANNFNHSSIIKRITMMQKQNPNPWRRSRALYVLPVAVLSLSAFATPEFIKPIEQAVTEIRDKGTQNAADVQVKVEEKLPMEVTSSETSAKEAKISVVETPAAVVEPIMEMAAAEDSIAKSVPIYDMAEVLPAFKGGDNALYQFLAANMHYPALAQEWGIQGRVFIQFVIEPDGSVDEVEVMRSVSKPDNFNKTVTVVSKDKKETETKVLTEEIFNQAAKALDDESVRVIKLTSGQWIPGKEKGKNVRVRFNIPIMFRLQ